MSGENVEVIRAGFDAFARGDVDAVLGLVAAELEWTPAIAPILGVDMVRKEAHPVLGI